MRAGVYVRISADPQGLRAGVERQREDCLSECARRGWQATVYEDNDRSAYSGKPRPAFERMLNDLKAGTIGALVAWAPDRLTRHLRELEDLVGLIESTRATVVTLQAGEWDLTTPEGRFQARMLGLLARLEAEKIASRVKRARRQAAEKGLPHHGGGEVRRPWGFESDRITHHPLEAEEVRDAARRIIRGESLRSVAKRYGKGGANMKAYLQSGRPAGFRENGGKLYPAVWEPLLDEETWRAVRAVLSRPVPPQTKARKYLLTGFLRCGICGSPIVGARHQRRPGYRCRGCGNVRRFADPLEDHVIGAVLERAELPGVGEVDPALAAAVAGYEARLDEATEMWMEGALPKAKYLGLKQELEARLEDAQDRLAASASPWKAARAWELSGEEVEDESVLLTVAKWRWWQGASFDERRGLIAEHVDRIIVNRIAEKTYRFEPGSIVIHWA